MKLKSNYYLNKTIEAYPYYLTQLEEAETKGEFKSALQGLMDQVKKEEHPKGETKKIITYLKTLKKEEK